MQNLKVDLRNNQFLSGANFRITSVDGTKTRILKKDLNIFTIAGEGNLRHIIFRQADYISVMTIEILKVFDLFWTNLL